MSRSKQIICLCNLTMSVQVTRILYEHLLFSSCSADHISMLLISDTPTLRTPWKREFHCQKCTLSYRHFFCLSGRLLFNIQSSSSPFYVGTLFFLYNNISSSILVCLLLSAPLLSTVSSGFGRLQLGTLALASSGYCASAFLLENSGVFWKFWGLGEPPTDDRHQIQNPNW